MERQQGSDVADMPCSTPSTPSSSVSQSQSSASRLVLLLRTLSGTNLKTKKANDSKSPKARSREASIVDDDDEDVVTPKLKLTSQKALSPSAHAICRICLEGEDLEAGAAGRLISPCECKGSAGFIHQGCLARWILERRQLSCELCKHAYRLLPSEIPDLPEEEEEQEQAQQEGAVRSRADALYIETHGGPPPVGGYARRRLPSTQFTLCRIIGITLFFVLTIVPCVICMLVVYHRWKDSSTMYCDLDRRTCVHAG